jgi:UDP-MurNAc hydroxylase
MRVTGLGHAGLFIETRGGTILADPWVYPAYFGSWIPFPDNRHLDWEKYGQADYLYVSHRHADHFDPRLLTEVVSKDIAVLLPEYPTDDLERDLRGLGFHNIIYTKAGVPMDLGGVRIMITPLKGPGDGPIGDSSLSVDDGTGVILDQNDAHPLNLDALLSFGAVDAYFTQYSGAIWWPMVYDLPLMSKQHFAELKREAQTKRAMFYLDKIGAPHVFPLAGPPCFLDDDLFDYNGTGRNGESIFTDQAEFIRELEATRSDMTGHMFLPGTVVDINDGQVTVTQELYSEEEIAEIFENKWEYLARQRDERQAELVEERDSRAEPMDSEELFQALKGWWEPLMKRAPTLCQGIGHMVKFTIGDLQLIVDFPNAEVRRFTDEQPRYWFTVPADLVATNVEKHEVDWSNSIFLSMRFQVGRIGKFNEYLYIFFKCLSEQRIDYVENWYQQVGDTGDDVEIDGWYVQRRCPHLRADLTKTATIEGNILTCSMHDWKFNLETGMCLTSQGHPIRARRVTPQESSVPQTAVD